MRRDGLWFFVGERPLAEPQVDLCSTVTRLRQLLAALDVQPLKEVQGGVPLLKRGVVPLLDGRGTRPPLLDSHSQPRPASSAGRSVAVPFRKNLRHRLWSEVVK